MSDMHEAAGHAPAEPLDVHAAHEGAAPEQAHMQADPHAAAAGHEGQAQGEHEAQYLLPLEIPNAATLIEAATGEMHAGAHGRPHPSKAWFINPMFSLVLASLVLVIVLRGLRRPSLAKPGRLQMGVEALLGGLIDFFGQIIGPDLARKHIPYIGSLWLFILVNNLGGLLPGMKSPTSSLPTTLGLAALTIIYVRYHNIKAAGIKGYLHHLAGSPTDVVGWALSPLMFLLEFLGEFIKPASLGLRLFGNIFGEDKLLATFLGLGMLIVAAVAHTPTPWIGLPLHLPFYFMVLLLSTIQATVFTLLASIYLMLMMPHEHAHEEHGGEHEAAAQH